MHAAIYARRGDAHGVVHAHPDYCTALSCLRKPLPAFHYMVASFGGDDVPCVDFAAFGSGTLSQRAAEALGSRTACLLANHGMICHGGTLTAAANNALKLEMLARQYLLACMVGAPVLLSPDDMREASRRYAYYGHSRIPEVPGDGGN
jgi:L-fuculose-phosphate aldolase